MKPLVRILAFIAVAAISLVFVLFPSPTDHPELVSAAPPAAEESPVRVPALVADSSRAVARVASEEPVDQDAAPESGVLSLEVQVVSALDFSGVAGADLSIFGDPLASVSGVTDSDGRISVTLSDRFVESSALAVVEAPKYCRRLIRLRATDGELLVVLQPAATIEVALVDEQGDPYADVEVRLMPPNQQGRGWGEEWRAIDPSTSGPGIESLRARYKAALEAGRTLTADDSGVPGIANAPVEFGSLRGGDLNISTVFRDCLDPGGFTRRTDQEGKARWTGVPAAAGYQWGALDVVLFEIEPEPMLNHNERRGSALEVNIDLPSKELSGLFDVEPGETVSLQATAARRTGIAGGFPSAVPVEGARVVVKVYHQSSDELTRAQGFRSIRLEKGGWAGSENQFELLGVEPGRKILRGRWREEDGETYFVQREFDLAPGEYRYLSDLTPTIGVPVKINLNLVDSYGTPLDPETYFGEDIPWMAVHAIAWQDARTPTPQLDSILPMELGASTTLVGTPGERMIVSVDWPTDAPTPLVEGTKLVIPREVEVVPYSTPEIDLTVVALQPTVHLVRARFPSGVEPTRGEAQFIPIRDGSPARADLRVDVDGAISANVSLEPGLYRILAHTQAPETETGGSSWLADATLDATHSGELELSLERATSIEGVARRDDGSVLRDVALLFAPNELVATGGRQWTHRTFTDSEGHFTLHGLEPSKTYACSEGPTVRSSGLDEVPFVELQLP